MLLSHHADTMMVASDLSSAGAAASRLLVTGVPFGDTCYGQLVAQLIAFQIHNLEPLVSSSRLPSRKGQTKCAEDSSGGYLCYPGLPDAILVCLTLPRATRNPGNPQLGASWRYF